MNQTIAELEAHIRTLEAERAALLAIRNGVLRHAWELLDNVSRYVESEFGDGAIWADEETTAHEQLIEIAIQFGAHELAEKWQRQMETQP